MLFIKNVTGESHVKKVEQNAEKFGTLTAPLKVTQKKCGVTFFQKARFSREIINKSVHSAVFRSFSD